jgi:2'-5' RNA ligase
MRTFIAIRFSPQVDRALWQVVEQLRRADKLRGVKWVEPGNIHLTLQFLGEVEEKLLDQIASGLRKELADFPAFEASLSGLGAFPDRSRPRVIWAGVAQGARELEQLSARVQEANRALGFTPEDRPFRAHVTLGRVKGRCDVRALSGAMGQAGKEII